MDAQRLMLLALLPAAYLLGSIPTGLLVALSRGIDPRKTGSGNIGATNIGRLLGFRFFLLVFFLDLVKGALITFSAGWILGFDVHNHINAAIWVCIALSAIAGNVFSIFLNFKGGKGVATSAGVMLGFYPFLSLASLVGIAVFAVVTLITRYVSVGSITASIAFALCYIVMGLLYRWPMTGVQSPVLILALLVPVILISSHRANIRRLLNGTENRIARRKAPAAPTPASNS